MPEEDTWSYNLHFTEVKFRSSSRSCFKYIRCSVLAAAVAVRAAALAGRVERNRSAPGAGAAPACSAPCRGTSAVGVAQAVPKGSRSYKRKAAGAWLSRSPLRGQGLAAACWDAGGHKVTVFLPLNFCRGQG